MDRLISHYRVLHPLGEGGMGEVYAGFDETLKRRVAMKAIRAEHRLDTVAKARFLREARILSQLDHPHVCRVYDFLEEADAEWLVLELIEGKSLQVALRDGLGQPAALAIAEQIADALVAAHRAGVVHRDLKPANVMLTRGNVVKVLDFGLAQSGEFADQVAAGTFANALAPPRADLTNGPIDLTQTSAGGQAQGSGLSLGALVGTPAYMTARWLRSSQWPGTVTTTSFSTRWRGRCWRSAERKTRRRSCESSTRWGIANWRLGVGTPRHARQVHDWPRTWGPGVSGPGIIEALEHGEEPTGWREFAMRAVRVFAAR